MVLLNLHEDVLTHSQLHSYLATTLPLTHLLDTALDPSPLAVGLGPLSFVIALFDLMRVHLIWFHTIVCRDNMRAYSELRVYLKVIHLSCILI